MVDRKNIKKAFSLIAVMMILVIISVIMVLSMPLISTRHQRTATDREDSADGYYICFKDEANKTCQQTFSNGKPVSNLDCSRPNCVFSAPSNVDHLSFRIIGGGGGGAGVRKIGNSFIGFREYYQTDFLPKSVVSLKREILNNLQTKNSPFDVNNKLKDENTLFGILSRVNLRDTLTASCGRVVMSNVGFSPLQQDITDLRLVEGTYIGSYDGLYLNNAKYRERTVTGNPSMPQLIYIRLADIPVSTINNNRFPIRNNVSALGEIHTCASNSSSSFNSDILVSQIPYYKFIFNGERRMLYGGYGGHPGEVVTHITTDLKSNIVITLGEGGAGGDCYKNGGLFDFEKCHGENGTPTTINFGESSVYEVKARGGRGACHRGYHHSSGTDENDRRLNSNADTYEDIHNYDETGCYTSEERLALNEYDDISYMEKIKGQPSQAHEYRGVGDGGSGAGMKDRCTAGRLKIDVFRNGYTGLIPPITNTMTGSRYFTSILPLNSNNGVVNDPVCQSGGISEQYSYIRYDENSPQGFQPTGDSGYIGQRGSGGAVIISW